MTQPEVKSIALTPAEERFKIERGEPSFADMMQLASTLLKTGFLPKGLTTAGQVLAVILTGREMGLGPMAATRSIGIINGKPVLAADLQLALFKRAGGQSKWLANTETGAKLWLKHPNGDEHTHEFSMADAERAGLTKRGDTYQKFPQAMLRARCITGALKAIGFEPTAGVYDPDELGGLVPSGPPPVEERQPLTEKPAALAEPEPMPWDGKDAGPVMPFGDKKGTPLKDIDSETLVAALAWCIKKDPKKFATLITQLDETLASREGE